LYDTSGDDVNDDNDFDDDGKKERQAEILYDTNENDDDDRDNRKPFVTLATTNPKRKGPYDAICTARR